MRVSKGYGIKSTTCHKYIMLVARIKCIFGYYMHTSDGKK